MNSAGRQYDPKHMSKLANECRLKRGIQCLSMLPDLNPIENVWKLLKKEHLRTYKLLV